MEQLSLLPSSVGTPECWGESALLKKLLLAGQMGNLEVVPQRKYVGVGKKGNIPFTDEELEHNIWAQIAYNPDGCWEWKGRPNPAGYGGINWRWPVRFGQPDRREQIASRAVWILTRGPITSRDFICHRCDNPPCCRPDHLFFGSATINTADMVAKGRNRGPKSEDCSTTKLTRDDVAMIRTSPRGYGRAKELAEKFGVTTATIHHVRKGKTWR